MDFRKDGSSLTSSSQMSAERGGGAQGTPEEQFILTLYVRG